MTKLNTSFRTLAKMLVVGAILLGLGGCAPTSTDDEPKYVAVMDAGSSGTRVYLFSETHHVVSTIPLENSKVKIPLASFAEKPTEIGAEIIDPLVAALTPALAAEGITAQDVTVNVLGTAGMRKVNGAQTTGIYENTRLALEANGFRVAETATISGNDEALYAWADANDLNGTLGNPARDPIGIVEVGGASAQIAFALPETDSQVSADVQDVTVNGITYPVFTYSYLGLGQDDARRSALLDPEASTSCYPNSADTGVNLNASETITVVPAQAQYDYASCSQIFDSVIGSIVRELPFNTIETLPGFADTQFFGISAITFASEAFNAVSGDLQAGLEKAITTTCSGQNALVRVGELYGEDSQDYVANACINGTYISTLLDELSIPDLNLRATSHITGDSIIWARGFAVLDAWGQ